MDLFIIEHYNESEEESDVKMLLNTLNKYRLWEEFQRIAVAVIKVALAKLDDNLQESVDILVETLKYSVVSRTVVQESQLFSYVPEIMSHRDCKGDDKLFSLFAILVMQRMPLNQQELFYHEYKEIIKKSKDELIEYYKPGETDYPSGLYGVNPEERIFINARTAKKIYKYNADLRDDNKNDRIFEGDAFINENGVQILKDFENGCEGRLYGNVFVKKENKQYTIFNMKSNLLKQFSIYQLCDDNNNNNKCGDYNLFGLNEETKICSKGDINIKEGDEISFMIMMKKDIEYEKSFIKIGNKFRFVVNEDDRVTEWYDEDECDGNEKIKENKFIEVHHKFRKNITGKLEIKRINGCIFCIKISHANEDNKNEKIKYFWPLTVPYNLENIIYHNDNSDLELKGFFDKLVRYKQIEVSYFYMNDYLYSFSSPSNIRYIRNRYPFKIQNENDFKIKINIVGEVNGIKDLKYLKILINDGKPDDENNKDYMYKVEIKEKEIKGKVEREISFNDDTHHHVLYTFDESNTFSFMFTRNKLYMNFREHYDKNKYSFNYINVDSNVDYFITTETDMEVKNYKVSIDGMLNQNNRSYDNVFVNGNDKYKIEVYEDSPDAEFYGHNLLNREKKFDGIIEYNDDEYSTDRKGRFSDYKDSLIEIKDHGNLCIVRRKNKSEAPNQLEIFRFEKPKINNKYKDHRIGIMNSSAPGIKNACYMICGFQGLYHSNKILKLSYDDNREKNPLVNCVFKVLYDLDIANYSVNLTLFVEEMTKVNEFKEFNNNNQQDAGEFLISLLDHCIENSSGFKGFFTFNRCSCSSYCLDCGKKEKSGNGELNSLMCNSKPERFFPIYKIKIGSQKDVIALLNEESNNRDDDEVIDIVFYTEEKPPQVIYLIRKKKPIKGEEYLTLISNEKNSNYRNYKKLEIGNTKLYCYYDTNHPPITNVEVNVEDKSCCAKFEIEYSPVRRKKYNISCDYDLPIVEGGIYETEIAKKFMKERKEIMEIEGGKSNFDYAITDVKEKGEDEEDQIGNGYEKIKNKIVKELTTLKTGEYVLEDGRRIKTGDETTVYKIWISIQYSATYIHEGYLAFSKRHSYFWNENNSIYIEFKKDSSKCDFYGFGWNYRQNGVEMRLSDRSIYQYYTLKDNSFYIYFSFNNPSLPPLSTPFSSIGYIGQFVEDDEHDKRILAVENTIIYYDNKTYSIKNEILTKENCKEIIEKSYYVKNSEEIVYKDVLPFYRCYDLSIQSIIENYIYGCSVEERDCECKSKKKANKLLYSCILSSDLPQYLLVSNDFSLNSFIKITPTIKIRKNNEPNSIVEYSVYGFVIHRGNAGGGHYTCYFRRSESENIRDKDDNDNSWYFFDDDKVEKKKWDEILENLFTPDTHIKMVFLSRINDKSEEDDEEEDEECDGHDGIEVIKQLCDLKDDLTLKQYNMYFPPLLKEFDDYKNDIGKIELYENEKLKMKVIKPTNCKKCGKLYYPFSS